MGRAAQRAVRGGNGDVVDVVGARIRRRFEIRGGLEGDRTRGADVEQPGIGPTQRPGERRAGIRVGTHRLIDGARGVLSETGRTAGGNAGSLVHVGDGDCNRLVSAQRAVRGGDGNVINIIAAHIGGCLEVRDALEGDRTRGADVEQPGIGPTQRPGECCAGIRIAPGGLVDTARGVISEVRRGARGDARSLIHIADGDGNGLSRAAQRAIRSGDGDVIDVVGARIVRRLEVRRRLEGDGTRGADVEQGHIGAAEQPGQRRARIRVARGGLVDGTRRVLGETGRPVGGDDRRRVDEAGGVDPGAGKVQRLDIAGDGIGAVTDDHEQAGHAVIGDGVVGRRAVEEGGVGAVAAADVVIAGAAKQRVVARAAGQRVVACTAGQHIGVAVADDPVIAGAAGDVLDGRHGVRAAAHAINDRPRGQVGDDGLDRRIAGVIRKVGAAAADQRVAADAAHQRVVAVAAVQHVAVAIAGQQVVAGAADEVGDADQRIGAAQAVGGDAGGEVGRKIGGAGGVIRRIHVAAAAQCVVARAAHQRVVAAAAEQAVIASAAKEHVLATPARQGVGAVFPVQVVVERGAGQAVIARAAIQVDLAHAVGGGVDCIVEGAGGDALNADQAVGAACTIRPGEGCGRGDEVQCLRRRRHAVVDYVGAGAAIQCVVAGPTDQGVVPGLAAKAVIARPAVQDVGVDATVEGRAGGAGVADRPAAGARSAPQIDGEARRIQRRCSGVTADRRGRPRRSNRRGNARARVDDKDLGAAADEVDVIGLAEVKNGVVAGIDHEAIGSPAACENVVAAAAGERVEAVPLAGDRVGIGAAG